MKRAEKTAARMKPVWFPAGDRGLLLDLTGYGAQLGGLPPAEDRQALTRFARALSQRIIHFLVYVGRGLFQRLPHGSTNTLTTYIFWNIHCQIYINKNP